MKKAILIILSFLFGAGSLLAQSVWSNKSRVLPDKLRELPVGILMYHDPNPCYPVKEGDTFIWKHSTYAMSFKTTLTVIECGSFIWYDESGWHENMKYSSADFAKDFECPGAILMTNKTFIFRKNWRYGQRAYGGDALWYIIAKDESGKIYTGYSIIQTESKILTSN